MAKKPAFTVTGPGLEGAAYEELGPALSRSITEATRQRNSEATFYVRNPAGDVVAYSETDGKTIITVQHGRSK